MPTIWNRCGETTPVNSRRGSPAPLRSRVATDAAATASKEPAPLATASSSSSDVLQRSWPREGAAAMTLTSREPPVKGSGRIR